MNNKQHVSLKDIAKRTGVSVSTVSRALNDSTEISLQMRDSIKQVAREMNYRPNPFAVSLLKNSLRMIGIVVPDIVTYFYSSIISGIGDMARQHNYSIIITSSYESLELEKRSFDDLLSIRVEGILACISQETTTYEHLRNVVEQNVPLIFFDRCPLEDICSSVTADNSRSGKIATEHLIANGYRRIGFIGGANHLDIVKQRKHGYLEALRENNIPIDKELVVCEKMTWEDGTLAARRLLSLHERPDAIIAMNDTLTFAAMKEIKRHSLRIPSDIALIGYTDELHSNYVEPALTAITHQSYKMGEEACRLLLEQIENGGAVKHIVIPTHLQVRDSTMR